MIFIRKSSESEMIAEFLSGEYRSKRFSDDIKASMEKLSVSEQVITAPDLTNDSENALRKRVLGDFRGYGENRELFENFPSIADWRICRFERGDLEWILYIDYSYWNELSDGTRSPIIAAENIRKGKTVFDVPNDGFIAAAEHLKSGGKLPRTILITADLERFVIVEGHQRLTAYAMLPNKLDGEECIVGVCGTDEMKRWGKI